MTKKEYLEYKIEKLKNEEYNIDEIEKIKKLIEHHQKILDKIESRCYNIIIKRKEV